MFAIETDHGVQLMSRDELRKQLAQEMRGPSLADQLIAERHAANGASA